ncbi:hypothetical protein [Actinoplanes lobatus]|uniref:Uncharacterized protein n=1 Tax=Actinoplanes lobatus TaxID=113568 RepID=A0A7W7ML77_9ACTN|nr:hypothetical protein [Actinoplanes lobatus]MBB4754474.1 hypothetical protein [Actinoplanes lobatus]
MVQAAKFFGVAAFEAESATPLLHATKLLPLGRMVAHLRRIAHLGDLRPTEQRSLPHEWILPQSDREV